MKDLRCLMGVHGDISREFHVREVDYKEFKNVDIKETCIRCGEGKFLKGADSSKIVCWTSDPERFAKILKSELFFLPA